MSKQPKGIPLGRGRRAPKADDGTPKRRAKKTPEQLEKERIIANRLLSKRGM